MSLSNVCEINLVTEDGSITATISVNFAGCCDQPRREALLANIQRFVEGTGHTTTMSWSSKAFAHPFTTTAVIAMHDQCLSRLTTYGHYFGKSLPIATRGKSRLVFANGVRSYMMTIAA